MKLLHGTASGNVESILRDGFEPPSYFTTILEDAEYYAGTGGEADLQRREEAFENSTGLVARDEYDSWEMYERLYPAGQYPVVISLEIPDHLAEKLKADAGSMDGFSANFPIPIDCILSVSRVQWPSAFPVDRQVP